MGLRKANLELDQLQTHPDFTTRVPFTDGEHLNNLRNALRNTPKKAFDPLLVWEDPEKGFFILDGHYRAEAYRQAKSPRKTVPTLVFEGTRDEAILRAPNENAKAKLPLTSSERADWAWRMTRMQPPLGKAWRFTPGQIAEAVGGGERRCWAMRKRFKEILAKDDAASLTGRWCFDMEDRAAAAGELVLCAAEERRQIAIIIQRLRDVTDHRKNPDLSVLKDFRLQRRAQVEAFGKGFEAAAIAYDQAQMAIEEAAKHDPFMEYHFTPQDERESSYSDDDDIEPNF